MAAPVVKFGAPYAPFHPPFACTSVSSRENADMMQHLSMADGELRAKLPTILPTCHVLNAALQLFQHGVHTAFGHNVLTFEREEHARALATGTVADVEVVMRVQRPHAKGSSHAAGSRAAVALRTAIGQDYSGVTL